MHIYSCVQSVELRTHCWVSAALSETQCHSCSVRLYSSRCHSSEEKAEAQDTYYSKITKISEWHCWQTLGHTEPRGKLEENSAVTHCCPCGIWAVTANITSISGQSDWWMGKWWQGKSKRQRRRSRAMPTKWINIKAEMEAHPTSRCVAYFYQIKNWMMKAEIEN